MKEKVFIRCTNHFDPVWRRGFKKGFTYKDEYYISESELQDICISEWLEMAEKSDLKFDIECSLVLRNYLENNPQMKEKFQKLIEEGRFELLGGGEIIPDTNMPNGETLIRNLVYGFLWAKKEFGILPQIGCMNDSFGASTQIPQIFRGCEIKWLTGLSYSYPKLDYWRGADGSVVYIQQYFNKEGKKDLSAGIYYKPCEKCHGYGCDSCGNTGIDNFKMDGELSEVQLDKKGYPYMIIGTGGEETRVTLKLPEKVKRENDIQNEREYKFFVPSDLIEYHKDDIDRVDNPDERRVSAEIEGGPNSSGCLVSRIKIKQKIRSMESQLISLEKLCSMLYLQNRYYPDELNDVWRKVILSCFHDSITGTVVDPAYYEIMGYLDEAKVCMAKIEDDICEKFVSDDKKTISVVNHNSHAITDIATVTLPVSGEVKICDENKNEVPVYECSEADGKTTVSFLASDIPPLGVKYYYCMKDSKVKKCAPKNNNEIENEFYKIKADTHGIVSIYDKSSNKELINSKVGYANELILEDDIGDLWATRDLKRDRVRLGAQNSLESVTEYENYSEIRYKGRFSGNEDVFFPIDYKVMQLEWEQVIRLFKGVKRIEFKTNINWSCFDKRIRVSFPLCVGRSHDCGIYSVPYAALQRERYEMSTTGWNNANGDYPANEWAATASNIDTNVAVFNKGTQSYRIERNEMLVSILRSPTFPNGLYWPHCYNAPVYDEMRDFGEHSFEYALYSFDGDWKNSNVGVSAAEYNRPLMTFNGRLELSDSPVKLKSQSAQITSIKRAEDKNGIVLRIVEEKGIDGDISLTFGENIKKVFITNMLEENKTEAELVGNYVNMPIKGFEILTLKCCLT